jgi:antirestriction protein ArdC
MATVGMDYVDKTIENSAAYIKNWMKVLKNDKHMLVKASTQAKKAVRYITEGGQVVQET